MIALEASLVGKMMVKSPSVDVLSAPKSRTQTAALVKVVLALLFAEGVVL